MYSSQSLTSYLKCKAQILLYSLRFAFTRHFSKIVNITRRVPAEECNTLHLVFTCNNWLRYYVSILQKR